MADPTHEVKLKKDAGSEPTPITPEEIEAKAESIANSKIEQLKNDLIGSIQKKESRYGPNGPQDWDSLHESIKNDAIKEAEERAQKIIDDRLERDRKAQEEAKKTEAEKTEAQQREEMNRLTAEWQEAVADNLIPDIDEKVKSKLREGKTFQELSAEEQKDPGIKAYNEVLNLHAKLKAEGKSNSLYRTAQKFYNQAPAGAGAPVFGGSPPTPSTNEDYTYDEVAENRRQKFGF